MRNWLFLDYQDLVQDFGLSFILYWDNVEKNQNFTWLTVCKLGGLDSQDQFLKLLTIYWLSIPTFRNCFSTVKTKLKIWVSILFSIETVSSQSETPRLSDHSLICFIRNEIVLWEGPAVKGKLKRLLVGWAIESDRRKDKHR